MKFEHHILTRFNLRIFSESYSEDWFLHRLGLFEKYCLPSVARQTNPNFVWHLLFNEQRTLPHIDTIRRFNLDAANAQIHLLPDVPKQVQYASQNLINTDNHLLTTRIDNDDIMHPQFVERVQTEAIKLLESGMTEPHLLDFGIHFHWAPTQNKMVQYKVPYPTAFVSLLEPAVAGREIKTVNCGKHTKLHKEFTMTKIPFTGSVAVVHGKNIHNSLGQEPNMLWKMLRRLRQKKVWLRASETKKVLSDFQIAEGPH